MRTFTEQEKRILRRIAQLKEEKKLESISLGDICICFLKNEYISIDYSTEWKRHTLEFKFNSDIFLFIRDSSAVQARQKELEDKIIDTISLLKYLNENRLLLEIYLNSPKAEFDVCKSKYDKRKHFPCRSGFDAITEKYIVEQFCHKQYIIRQEFIDFVNHGFKTEEERHYKNNYKATWTGIFIALVIGIASIGISIRTQIKSEASNKENIHFADSCFNEIHQTLKMKMHQDSVMLNTCINEVKIQHDKLAQQNKNQANKLSNQLNTIITLTENNKPLKEIKAYIVNQNNNNTHQTAKENESQK